MNYFDTFSPVDPEFITILQEKISAHTSGKVFFFGTKGEVAEADGQITELVQSEKGKFANVGDALVRIDKIITLFGRPGPAYDEYDRYANACLTCEII